MEENTNQGTMIEHGDTTATQSILHMTVTLSDDDLGEEAKAQFTFHTDILHAFQLTARIVLANDRLTPIGRHLFCASVEQNYRNCKNVLNYVASHPELCKMTHPMPPVFVLCGAHRTGSTLLYNLLACDPASRAPSLLDMLHPVPPIARSDSAAQTRRALMARTFSERLKDPRMSDYERERNASHPSYIYEEDVYILYQGGLLVPHLEPHDSTELATWFYDNKNKDFVYEYHKVFIRMLNSIDEPQSHWLLKTPYHIFNLDTLLRHYPTVSLIMTHRQLHEVIPSSIRLGLAFASIYFDSRRNDAAIDTQMVKERRLRATDVQINRIVEFRRARPDVPVFDVLYDDLVMKPINTIRRIYNHFGLTWSDEFEQAMLTWLQNNPQGRQGRNTYTLEEFGLTRAAIEQKYENYIRMFLDSQKLLKTDSGSTEIASCHPSNMNIAVNVIK